MADPSEKGPTGGRMKVHLPSDLEPIYANLALLTHSLSEIVLDFAQAMPQMPQVRVRARVIMTPTNAKLLSRALTKHLARYESQHGEINVAQGTSLADQLFRKAEGEEEDEGDEGEESDGQ